MNITASPDSVICKHYQDYVAQTIAKRKTILKRYILLHTTFGVPLTIINSVSIASIAGSLGIDSPILKYISLATSSIALVLGSLSSFYGVETKIKQFRDQLRNLQLIQNQLFEAQTRGDFSALAQIRSEVESQLSFDEELQTQTPMVPITQV